MKSRTKKTVWFTLVLSIILTLSAAFFCPVTANAEENGDPVINYTAYGTLEGNVKGKIRSGQTLYINNCTSSDMFFDLYIMGTLVSETLISSNQGESLGGSSCTYNAEIVEGASHTLNLNITSCSGNLYIAGEKIVVDTDDTENETGPVSIGSTYYDSLKSAIEAIEYEDTIIVHQDIDVSDNIELNNKIVTIDLRGHTISGVGDAYRMFSLGTVYQRFPETILNLTSDPAYGPGVITGENGNNMGFADIYQDPLKEVILNLENVLIKDFSVTDNDGGAVFNCAAVVNMNAGAVIQNCSASGNGGGIYNIWGGTVTMNEDAKIINCTSGLNGGGIYSDFDDSIIYLNDSAMVCDNYVGAMPNDLYIPDGQIINAINLKPNAKIGVTTQTTPSETPIVIANVSSDVSSCFEANDSTNCMIGYDQGQIILKSVQSYKGFKQKLQDIKETPEKYSLDQMMGMLDAYEMMCQNEEIREKMQTDSEFMQLINELTDKIKAANHKIDLEQYSVSLLGVGAQGGDAPGWRYILTSESIDVPKEIQAQLTREWTVLASEDIRVSLYEGEPEEGKFMIGFSGDKIKENKDKKAVVYHLTDSGLQTLQAVWDEKNQCFTIITDSCSPFVLAVKTETAKLDTSGSATGSDKSKGGSNVGAKVYTGNVNTGDNSSVLIWLLLTTASLSGALYVAGRIRKARELHR